MIKSCNVNVYAYREAEWKTEWKRLVSVNMARKTCKENNRMICDGQGILLCYITSISMISSREKTGWRSNEISTVHQKSARSSI